MTAGGTRRRREERRARLQRVHVPRLRCALPRQCERDAAVGCGALYDEGAGDAPICQVTLLRYRSSAALLCLGRSGSDGSGNRRGRTRFPSIALGCQRLRERGLKGRSVCSGAGVGDTRSSLALSVDSGGDCSGLLRLGRLLRRSESAEESSASIRALCSDGVFEPA